MIERQTDSEGDSEGERERASVRALIGMTSVYHSPVILPRISVLFTVYCEDGQITALLSAPGLF